MAGSALAVHAAPGGQLAVMRDRAEEANDDGRSNRQEGTVNLAGLAALAPTRRGGYSGGITTPVRARYTGYRFPAEIIGHAVWLNFRFPLGLAHGGGVAGPAGHHRQPRIRAAVGTQIRPAVRQSDLSPPPRVGDKWHLDEVALKIAGVKLAPSWNGTISSLAHRLFGNTGIFAITGRFRHSRGPGIG
jgi:hypothetical protein